MVGGGHTTILPSYECFNLQHIQKINLNSKNISYIISLKKTLHFSLNSKMKPMLVETVKM